MSHIVTVLCPDCDMPCNEYVVDGICGICEYDCSALPNDPIFLRKNELLQVAVDLLLESRKWGKANGYPAARHYPQYQALRDLGSKAGGHSSMVRLAELAAAEVDRGDDPDWSSGGFLEHVWSGIGGWMA